MSEEDLAELIYESWRAEDMIWCRADMAAATEAARTALAAQPPRLTENERGHIRYLLARIATTESAATYAALAKLADTVDTATGDATDGD